MNFMDKSLKDLTSEEAKVFSMFVSPDLIYYLNLLNEHRKDIKKDKGVSDITIKEMTAEQFDESEHPRDESGKFTDKLGGATTAPSPDKGSWGGYRKYAGRLPKDPIQMKDRLTQKIKEDNPNITDEELNKQLVDYAVANKKPDLAFAVTNPVEYQKQRDMELQDAMNSKYNKMSVRGKSVSLDGPNDIYDTKQSVKGSVTKWNQELTKSKSIFDSWNVFRNKNAEKDERDRAKLILGVALLAGSIAFTALLFKKQNARKAGFKINEALKENPFRTLQGGMPDIREIPSDDYISVLNVVEPRLPGAGHISDARAWQEIATTEMGRFHKLVNWALSPIIGKNKAVVWGSKITGFKHPRWRLPEYTLVKTGVGTNYIPAIGDRDLKFGLDMFKKVKETSKSSAGVVPNVENIAIANGWIRRFPKDPIEGTLIRAKKIPGLTADMERNRWIVDNEQDFLRYLYSYGGKVSPEGKIIKGGKLSKYIYDPIETSKLNLKPEQSMAVGVDLHGYSFKRAALPTEMERFTTEAEQKAWDVMAESYEQWGEKGKELGQLLSRRMLTFLIPVFGVSGTAATSMYYFHKDISDALDTTGDPASNLVKVMSILDKAKPNKVDNIDKQIQLEKNRAKRIENELFKEALRQNVINDLIDQLHTRAQGEGAVSNKSQTEGIIRKRFNQNLTDLGYAHTKAGVSRLARDLNDPQERARIVQAFQDSFDDEIGSVYKSKASAKNNLNSPVFQSNYDYINEMENSGQTFDDKAEEVKSTGKTKADANETVTRGLDLDLVLKGFSEEQQQVISDNLTEDEVLNLVAYQMACMFSDISESCQMAIESGMPGESRYEGINRILEDMYAYMKDNAKGGKSPESKISEKSFDNSAPMSSTIDSSGGLLVGDDKKPKNQKCEVCGKIATEEVVRECKREDCPNSFLETIEVKE